MALLFVEGFDIYGASEAEMTDGVYLDTTNISLQTTEVRTGTYAIQTAGVQNAGLRRALYGEFLSLGMGFAMFVTEYPVESNTAQICQFKNDNNSPQVTIMLSTAGNIIVGRGGVDVGETFTELGRTTNSPCITDAWQHFEVQVVFSDTVGSVEVRLDGVTQLQLTGLDTIATTTFPNCNQVECCGSRAVINGANLNWQTYVDDWYCYDFTGTENNDWIGDRRVLTQWPNDNGAVQEWTANGASAAYDCIDDNPADGDTTYIEAASTSLPRNATFQLDNLPSDVASVQGVQIYVKSKKTDAGQCDLQVSMQQGASDEATGVNRPISTIYTHRTDMFELDPSTGALWTPSGFNSAVVDLERTA